MSALSNLKNTALFPSLGSAARDDEYPARRGAKPDRW